MLQYLSPYTTQDEPVQPQPPVKHEQLPAWQQLIIESRNIRTATNHLAHTLHQQVTTAKEHCTRLDALGKRMYQSWHCEEAL